MKKQAVVLVAGAINTDLVGLMDRAPEAGETITGTGFAVFGGGKAANQAVAVARTGGAAYLVGAVGDDQFGKDRLADLDADRVDTSSVEVIAGGTSGVALILVENGGENRIAYIPGTTLQVTPEATLAAYERIRPDLVLAPNEVPHGALRSLLEAARSNNVRTMLNAAPDPTTSVDLLENVDILIVNEHEAIEMLGQTVADHGDAAMKLAQRYALTAVVTAGADGVYAGDGGQSLHVAGIPVEAVDTTGAGDAFCGAFAAELAGGATLEEALRFAVQAASISVTRHGAQASIAYRNEVVAAMAECHQGMGSGCGR